MKYLLTLFVILSAQWCYPQAPDTPWSPATAAQLDQLFAAAYPSSSPGAAVLLAKGNKVLYRKAFGMANLELGVPLQPDHVFQLASLTKQFTSVAVLMLVEQGKLRLTDPLSTFLPDYPNGNQITIHHLLNHTSGIVSYTNLPEFRSKSRMDLTPEEIIAAFKDLPLEFAPGEQHAYSNSGYVLLGFIVEQVAGMPYAAFIQQHLFTPLGMTHSFYADPYALVPNRATGYQLYEGQYENAEYMSPTIPYAAGSLLSTVDDLLLWNTALRTNALISAATKQLVFTNHTLNNGKHTNYGYGWYVNEIANLPTLEHTGGINGYTASGIYVPDSNLYAVVLTNLDNGVGPELLNIQAVAALLGKPYAPPLATQLPEKELKKWVGAYQFDGVVRFITFQDGALYSQRENGRPLKLEPLGANQFRFENRTATYTFSAKKGKKQVLYQDRIEKSQGVETDVPMAEARTFVQLPPTALHKYVGTYDLQPAFDLEVSLQDNHLVATAMGQPPLDLHAESETRFFIQELSAPVEFVLSPDGTVESIRLTLGGQAMTGRLKE